MNETSQFEEPVWSCVRNPETVAEGLTITMHAAFRNGRRDWETGRVCEFGCWPIPEEESALEEKLKRQIRLRNAGGAEPPKEKP